MRSKKNPNVDLRNKRPLFLGLGAVISLLLVIGVFSYTSSQSKNLTCALPVVSDEDIMEIIPSSVQPPPPKPKPIKHIQIVEVVEDAPEDLIDIDIDPTIFHDEIIDDPIVMDEPEEPVDEPEVFIVVEEQADFVGGIGKFYEFVGEEMNYPAAARRMNVQGKVYVSFIVNENGEVTEVKAIKGIGSGCDEEAVRVVKFSPNWKPGKQRGRPVKVRRVIPIVFKLS